jgi:ferritin
MTMRSSSEFLPSLTEAFDMADAVASIPASRLSPSPSSAVSALAAHVNIEHRAARLYQQLVVWCERNSWPGSAEHFRRHAIEEYGHSQEYIDYVVSRDGGDVLLGTQFALTAGDLPGNLLDAFTMQLEMDREILASLNEIARMARTDSDEDAIRFVHTHTKGNVEGIAGDVVRVDWLRRAGNDAAALQTFDRGMGGK